MFERISEQFRFDKISEQFQSFQRPVNELAAVNAKALEQLTQKHANLVSALLNDGVAYAEGVKDLKDVAGVVEFQKAYNESLQEKLVNSAKETYAILVETHEKASEVIKDAFAQVKEASEAATNIPSEAAKAMKPRTKTTVADK